MTQSSIRNLATNLVPTFNENIKIGEAKLAIVKGSKQYKTINYVYLTDDTNKLTGTISIKDILSENEDVVISTIMTNSPISVHESSHQERVARLALDHNIKAMPVVGLDGTFIGAIPSDTILQILDEEMHEDILRIGGHAAIVKKGNESIFMSVVSRAPWLIIGTLGGILTAHIIKEFENFSGTTIAIASFIPLIVYVASAVVAQLNALMIRQISTGVKFNIFIYAIKQFAIISIIAVILSLLLELVLMLLGVGADVRLSITAGLFFTCLSAIVAGVFIPHLFSKFKIDPASATGPVATIIQDMTSVVIFLTIAHLI
jgi:magnesium transporter